jgi:hypothetical protein
MSLAEVLPIRVIELNTEMTGIPGWRCETAAVRCSACKKKFRLGWGMAADTEQSAITTAHLKLCEGDSAVTLMKIQDLYKQGKLLLEEL